MMRSKIEMTFIGLMVLGFIILTIGPGFIDPVFFSSGNYTGEIMLVGMLIAMAGCVGVVITYNVENEVKAGEDKNSNNGLYKGLEVFLYFGAMAGFLGVAVVYFATEGGTFEKSDLSETIILISYIVGFISLMGGLHFRKMRKRWYREYYIEKTDERNSLIRGKIAYVINQLLLILLGITTYVSYIYGETVIFVLCVAALIALGILYLALKEYYNKRY